MRLLRTISFVAVAVLAAGAMSFAEETAAAQGSGSGLTGDKLQVKLFLYVNEMEMEIDSDALNAPVRYLPNSPDILGIGMSYNGLGFRLTNVLESGVDDERLYGATKFRDYQLYYYSASLCADLGYQRYRGFYLDKPESFGYTAGDPPTIRDDLELRNITFNLYYVISTRLSLPAAFEQTQIQRESGGSFLLMMSLQQNDISSDSSLIPPSAAPQVGMEYRGGRYYNALLGAGYGYGFICGHFFFTPVLMYGMGITRAREMLGADSVVRYDLAGKLIFKLGLGYNGESYYWGFSAVFDAVWYFVENADSGSSGQVVDEQLLDITVTTGYMEMYFGMKFDI
ncbi:MAG TPA: DUF4421 family protein [Spirochaetota bacterium]|nr:DUF4421 family protein [Spirochaetota bacterium]